MPARRESLVPEQYTVEPLRLTIKTVARIFNVIELTLGQWRKKDGFPYIRLPTPEGTFDVRFDINQILDWAESNRKGVNLSAIPEEIRAEITQDRWDKFSNAASANGLFGPTVTPTALVTASAAAGTVDPMPVSARPRIVQPVAPLRPRVVGGR